MRFSTIRMNSNERASFLHPTVNSLQRPLEIKHCADYGEVLSRSQMNGVCMKRCNEAIYLVADLYVHTRDLHTANSIRSTDNLI